MYYITYSVYTKHLSSDRLVVSVLLLGQPFYTLDENVEAFVMHVALLTSKIIIYPASKVQITLFVTKEVTILAE